MYCALAISMKISVTVCPTKVKHYSSLILDRSSHTLRPTTTGDVGRFLTKAHEQRLPKAPTEQIPNNNNIA